MGRYEFKKINADSLFVIREALHYNWISNFPRVRSQGSLFQQLERLCVANQIASTVFTLFGLY